MSSLAEKLEQAPRWFLSITISGMIALIGILFWAVTQGVASDVRTAKETAVYAKSVGEENKQAIENLAKSVDEIKKGQSNFQDKYDRNQEENQRVFRQILAAVAVKQ